MEQKKAIIQEIYRRGLQDRLPPEKRQIADELVRRGVIQIEQQAQEPVEQIQEPTQQVEQPTEEGKFIGGIAGDPRQLEALGRGALKGATLGISRRVIPPIAAGVAKLAGVEEPFGELVEESKEIEAEKERKLKEERPAEFAGAEMAGALVSPAGVPAMKTAQKIGGIKGLAVAGAGEGALVGYGYGEGLQDIKEGALVGGVLGGGLGVLAKGAKLALGAIKPITGRISPKKAEAQSLIKTLKKEGTTPEEARAGLQRMQDEGMALIDVVDPRSSIIAEIPTRAYERKTIDTIDNYVNQLNTAGNKAKKEVLELVSKNKISAEEGAELLGQNAQEVIKRQKKARTANAKPLYEKAKTGFIDANDPILQVPVVKEAIEQAKKESLKFGTEGIGSLKGQKDNSIAVLHQAKDYLYRKSKDFTDLENARYGQVYNQLSDKLKKNPAYKEASKVWAGETEGLERLYKQRGIGNIAKKYEKGDIEGIQSSFRNIFKKPITDEQVARLKKSLPDEQFNAIVRKDLDTLIDESGDAGSNLTTSLFGKGDAERSLKNKRLDLIFTPRQKRGLRKTSELLDSAKAKEKQLDKMAFRTPKQQFEYIYGGQFAIANAALKVWRGLVDSPQQREAFVNYLFTPAGQQLLEQIARSNKRDAQNLIIQTIPAILTQTQGE